MKLAIKGHPERGKEVIEILEMLGGKNGLNYDGSYTRCFYFLDNTLICSTYGRPQLQCYTLEEFLEKFPYKIGDKVLYKSNNTPYFIRKMFWENDKVLYELSDEIYSCGSSLPDTIIFDVDVVKLQPYKEELTMKKKSKLINIEPKLVGNESVHFPIPSNMKLEVKDGMCYLYRDCCEHKESKCLQDIKEYLDNATPEQLEEDWKEMRSLVKSDPIASEYVKQCKEGVNLQKLERQLDEALEKETTESLNKWMDEENYCQVIGNDTSSNGVNTAASLINGEIIEENINEKSFPPYMDYDITETKEQEDIEEKDEKSANHVFDTEIISFDIAQRDKYELDLQGKFKVVLREGKYYVERIKPQYPKTYKECCKVVNASPYVSLVYDRFDGKTYSYDIDNLQIYENLRKLKISHDAYWKIAGDWKYDVNKTEEYFYIVNKCGRIVKEHYMNFNHILAFPTEEMCNIFYENFKELIEQCKELL